MSDKNSSRAQEKHNEGQRDANNGVYSPPPIVPFPFSPSKEDSADRKAYDAGWRNAKDQK